jgi:hypothetical protein
MLSACLWCTSRHFILRRVKSDPSFLTDLTNPCNCPPPYGCPQRWTQTPLPRIISPDWNALRMNKRHSSPSFSSRSLARIRGHGSHIRAWLAPVTFTAVFEDLVPSLFFFFWPAVDRRRHFSRPTLSLHSLSSFVIMDNRPP